MKFLLERHIRVALSLLFFKAIYGHFKWWTACTAAGRYKGTSRLIPFPLQSFVSTGIRKLTTNFQGFEFTIHPSDSSYRLTKLAHSRRSRSIYQVVSKVLLIATLSLTREAMYFKLLHIMFFSFEVFLIHADRHARPDVLTLSHEIPAFKSSSFLLTRTHPPTLSSNFKFRVAGPNVFRHRRSTFVIAACGVLYYFEKKILPWKREVASALRWI